MDTKPTHIDFESNNLYPHLDQFPNNKQFKIPCWKTKTNDCNEVLIMINGFLEGVLHEHEVDDTIKERKINNHLMRYNSIANESIKNGIVSLLIAALPF